MIAMRSEKIGKFMAKTQIAGRTLFEGIRPAIVFPGSALEVSVRVARISQATLCVIAPAECRGRLARCARLALLALSRRGIWAAARAAAEAGAAAAT